MTDMESSLHKDLGEVFRSEASDIFRAMEAAVLDLETQSPDADAVHRLFRAVHTLKGSSGMFGLTGLATLAHELESLIERIREKRIFPGASLISLVLKVTDRLRFLVDHPEEGGAETDARLIQMLAEATQGLEKGDGREEEGERKRKIAIFFKPFPGIFMTGMDPAMVLGELRDLGNLSVRVLTGDVPDLETLDAEKCFLAFDMVLETEVGDQEIQDVFLFVEEDSEIRISVLPLDGEEERVSGPVSSSLPTENLHGAEHSSSVKEKGKMRGEAQHPEHEDVRIAAFRLDTLMNLVGDLVMQQARLNAVARTVQSPLLNECLEGLDRIALNLKDCVLNLRMTPISGIFTRFRRLVRDLAQELGKEVNLEIEGGETELDKSLIDGLGEPLVHLVRNALDHGIESPEERRQKGKPSAGTLRLSAAAVEGRVEILISDDGRGINREAVLKKARERGLIREDEVPLPGEVDALIFHPGLSTAAVVGSVSGRGVGMDVVRRQIEALAGRITLYSEAGKGIRIRLSMPLTLAIVECLLVRVGGGIYGLPVTQVEACMDFYALPRDGGAERRLLLFRKKALPYIHLRTFFRMADPLEHDAQVVLVRSESGLLGLVVDTLIGTQQMVIKSMGDWYDRQDGISGAAVLGDGRIAFVLDVQGLWRRACEEAAEGESSKKYSTRM